MANLLCLSVKQPWATQIAVGLKTIETRTWATRYRGPLAIHAGKVFDAEAAPLLLLMTTRQVEMTKVRGVILALVELVDCRPMTEADEEAAWCSCFPGAFAWVLRGARCLPRPMMLRGKLGLFSIDVAQPTEEIESFMHPFKGHEVARQGKLS